MVNLQESMLIIRACLGTLKTANFAEYSYHARRACEGVPGVRQVNESDAGGE